MFSGLEENTIRASDPPQNPRDQNSEECPIEDILNVESDFREFFTIFFRIECVYSRKFYKIFETRSDKQKEYLKKLIEKMKFGGVSEIECIIMIVIKLFVKLNIELTFEHFLSLNSFILVYIREEMEALRSIDYDPSTFGNFENLEKGLFQRVTQNMMKLINSMEKVIRKLRKKIEAKDYFPKFREIYCAIYHYYKHRYVQNNYLLSVDEYFDLIKATIEELKTEKAEEYLEFEKGNPKRISYTKMTTYGKMKTVLKLQGERVVTSTCYSIPAE